METRFISDVHFGHANAIKYDSRPFGTVEEVDERMVELWNGFVDRRDLVYILGDLSWHDAQKTATLVGRLNGRKVLVLGNHDDKIVKFQEVAGLFESVVPYAEISVPNNLGKVAVLSHYPIPFYNKVHYGSAHLYGHVHNSKEADVVEEWRGRLSQMYSRPVRMANVGCMMDYIGYIPRTIEEVAEARGF